MLRSSTGFTARPTTGAVRGSEGVADRRSTAVVFHGDGSDSQREPQGADRDLVGVPKRCGGVQDLGDEPDYLGGDADRAGVSATLDRHGDLPSRRQAAAWAGRLSVA